MQPYIYELPSSRIAERPCRPYDAAKLLVLDRQRPDLQTSTFSSLASFLSKDYLLVFNDTKVEPRRLIGRFADSGGKCEVLLLRQTSSGSWLALAKPLKKFRVGRELLFGTASQLRARVLAVENDQAEYNLELNPTSADWEQALAQAGLMPIPPYIRRGQSDSQDIIDYQTFFAKAAADKQASVAAPTASLHFTPELFASIAAAGIDHCYLTLHVGAASFLPLWQYDDPSATPQTETLANPPQENLQIPAAVKAKILAHKARGGKILAIGTTVVRALESMEDSERGDQTEATELFITPGYKFRFVDALVTNFHQPATTHLLLVEALCGDELLHQAYQYALANDFRFLSYGDGMLIL